MTIDPVLLEALRAAFPTSYLAVPGTSTVSGVQVLRGKGNQLIWFWPDEARFSKPGLTLFDEARVNLDLLPDLDDLGTWRAALHVLADQASLAPGRRSVSFNPKASEVRDKKRWSVSKATVGWTARTLTRSATFPIPDVTDERVALLRALALTNCACGRGTRAMCPQHGETRFRPWR